MEAVRSAFRGAAQAYLSAPDGPKPRPELNGESLPIGQLAQLALGLHQALPEALCTSLGLPVGSSYSQGAKRLQLLLLRQEPTAAT
jgi:hypothetical protein